MDTAQTISHDTFDSAYRDGVPPWVIGEPQPTIVELAESGAITGAVLDVGCGSGHHTIHLARLGYDVRGIDFSAHAVRGAAANAAGLGVAASFTVLDALYLDGPPRFDTVLDSALFHVFDADEQRRYARSLARVCRPGGTVFVLALVVGGEGIGPEIEPDAVREAFTDGWRIEGITDSRYRGRVDKRAAAETGLPVGVRDFAALLARITRI